MAERTNSSDLPLTTDQQAAEDGGRYSRQQRFAPLGQAGQAKLASARVLVCGCGALGSVIAERLARSGVGTIRLVDRDWVELSNLQRQTLFTERHAAQSLPKAIAAAESLGLINSQISVQPFVDDLTWENIDRLADQCDLLLDGTDNFETRFLINDYCVKHGVPWIHAGCLGASGQILSILPGQTACFRCLVPELPSPESLPTCDTAGVLGPAIGIIASWQAAEALKILSGNSQLASRHLIVLDCWESQCRLLSVPKLADCPTCGQHTFDFLAGKISSQWAVLCGKNAVQVVLPSVATLSGDLRMLESKWQVLGQVHRNAFFVRLMLPRYQVTVFLGGRAIVEGTTNPSEAKSILARVMGS